MTNYYFHKADWSINTDPKNGIKVSIPLIFALVPILGALFLMFLPVIGFVLLFQQIAQATANGARSLVGSAVVPMPAAGTAHLTGRESVEKGSDDTLKDLESEIASRRK